jgi:putative aminopeptidase FrvX
VPVVIVYQYSNYEEVGHGASTGIPGDFVELVAVDMGAIGEGLQGSEHAVSICCTHKEALAASTTVLLACLLENE